MCTPWKGCHKDWCVMWLFVWFCCLCTGTCKARGVHEGLRYEPSRTATRGRDVTFTGPPCGWQKEALCGISYVREMVESFGRCKKRPRFSFPLWEKWYWRKLKVFYVVWSWNATSKCAIKVAKANATRAGSCAGWAGCLVPMDPNERHQHPKQKAWLNRLSSIAIPPDI